MQGWAKLLSRKRNFLSLKSDKKVEKSLKFQKEFHFGWPKSKLIKKSCKMVNCFLEIWTWSHLGLKSIFGRARGIDFVEKHWYLMHSAASRSWDFETKQCKKHWFLHAFCIHGAAIWMIFETKCYDFGIKSYGFMLFCCWFCKCLRYWWYHVLQQRFITSKCTFHLLLATIFSMLRKL